MHYARGSIVGLVVLGLGSGCASPCIDDGLGQAICTPPNAASDTDGSTGPGPASATVGPTATDSATTGTMTQGMSGSQTGVQTDGMGTADGTATDSGSDTDGTTNAITVTDSESRGSETDTEGPSLWCVDADGDGFGDPGRCQPSAGPIDGSVPNDDDCDDTDVATFPGAAPNDDPAACMRDVDDDDWGDDAPPPGVLAGTDCDDTDVDAFPGAAPNETPADLCAVDADGDGWGDANPGGGGGPLSGSDCFDTNPDLNPDTLQLTAFSPYLANMFTPRTLDSVDPATAALSTFVTLTNPMGGTPNINIATVGLDELGQIYANDVNGIRLYTVDYAGTCMMGQGQVAAVAMTPYDGPGEVVCGLEFGPDGMLYGIDYDDQLLVFDTATGQVTASLPLVDGGVGVDIDSCGMALDCTEGRLLVANGLDHTIYAVDPATGATTVVRDLSAFFGPAWNPTGLAYDPVSRNAYLSVGASLWTVDLDTMDPPVQIGPFGELVSNLQYLPICQ